MTLLKTATEPLHAGEVFFLWEGITSGYKLVEVIETYMMNSEGEELKTLLQGIIKGTYLHRINKMEEILKEEGFTIPPRPASKQFQGSPEMLQDVSLHDDEVIKSLIFMSQDYMILDAKAVAAASGQRLLQVFTDVLFADIKAYKGFLELGLKRNVFQSPPEATAKKDSLHMGEVSFIWEELQYRHVSLVNLEVYTLSTDDKELKDLLEHGIKRITLPQIEEMENILKREGFTAPPRPVRRLQQTPGKMLNKIRMSDPEVIDILTLAFQVAITHHLRGITISLRKDIMKLFEGYLSTEIEHYQKLLKLARDRHILEKPPIVSSRRI